MKNNKIVILIFCLTIVARSFAQGYGGRSYPHSASMLTSAKTTNINLSGFVMVGAMATASGTQHDFVIDQVDQNGLFSTPAFWSVEYDIRTDLSGPPPSCGVSYNRNYGCLGVDIIETNPGTNNEKYAIAGVCNDGIFFACLDVTGMTVAGSESFWRITQFQYQSPALHRPTIRESSTPGWYYICGDIGGIGYVIKVNAVYGTTGGWQRQFYGDIAMQPRSLIESQGAADLIVVGRLDQIIAGYAAEAFFMRIDPTTGAFSYINCYSDGYNGDEWFTSIEYANSPTGGSGYIIGGRVHSSNLNNSAYRPWMIKVDPSGNMIWSTLIRHSVQSGQIEIFDVVERYNTVANPATYEYFGVGHTPNTTSDYMTVWKLDDTGNPTNTGVNGWNEFPYNLGSLSSSTGFWNPVHIEIIGNGGNIPADGIQVFGTDLGSAPSNNHMLVGAYFDGSDGCYTPSKWSWVQGPGMWSQPSIGNDPFDDPCPFDLVPWGASVNPGTPCSWSNFPLAWPASNARGTSTGIQQHSENSGNVSVHPNPTNKSFTLEFKNEINGPALITVINSLGQIEKKIDISDSASNEVVLDFEALQLTEGLYFVNVTINKETFTTKVMYKK